jgi:hypothetical protein
MAGLFTGHKAKRRFPDLFERLVGFKFFQKPLQVRCCAGLRYQAVAEVRRLYEVGPRLTGLDAPKINELDGAWRIATTRVQRRRIRILGLPQPNGEQCVQSGEKE